MCLALNYLKPLSIFPLARLADENPAIANRLGEIN
jgi:hypothetical protein